MSSTATGAKLRRTAKPMVDNKQEAYLPLDYSFKAIAYFPEILRERPRRRGPHAALVLEDELSAGGSTDTVDLAKTCTTALRLNNNMIVNWEGLLDTMERLLVAPTANLRWLDLSFNDLKTIDSALLALPNMTMLYLHANNIGKMSEADKLSELPNLKSLSIYGNPIEGTPGYRHYILSRIPQLQTFDFSGITKADRATADTWKTMIAPKKRSKKPGREDD